MGAIGTLAALGLLSIWYAFVAQPMADDYAIAVYADRQGAVGFAQGYYAHQSGRVLSHALAGLILGSGELPRIYPWVLLGVSAVALLCTYALVRAIAGKSLSRGPAWAWATVLHVLVFALRTSPAETVYWATGAINYQLGFSLAVLVVAVLVVGARRRPSWLGGTLLALMALAVGSFHEVTGIMLVVVLGGGMLCAQRLGSGRRMTWLACFACAGLGTLSTIVAPATRVRGDTFPNAWDVGWTLHHLPRDAFDALPSWATDPKLLLASLFLWLSPRFRRPQPSWTRSAFAWSTAIGLTAVVAIVAVLGAARWATGGPAVPRVLDLVHQLFLLAWFLVLFLWTRGESRRLRTGAAGVLRCLALGSLSLALLTTGNGRHAVGDLVHGRASRRMVAMHERYAQIRRAREQGQLDLTVPRLPWMSGILVRMDIREDPDYWTNRFVARYFGTRSIAVPERANAGE